MELLQNRFHGQSGIIYTTSVKDCDQLASELRQQNCRVASYHASLEPADRTKVHTGWRDNKYQVEIISTTYFMWTSYIILTHIEGRGCNYCIRNGNW